MSHVQLVLKRSEDSGFGFSLLGSSGPPHVIYDIVQNSPAAKCGLINPGDKIVKVNGIDVLNNTTKEVLKYLRLSEDLVTLELKKELKTSNTIQGHLENLNDCCQVHFAEANNEIICDMTTETQWNKSFEHESELIENKPHSSIKIQLSQSTSSPSHIPFTFNQPIPKKSKKIYKHKNKDLNFPKFSKWASTEKIIQLENSELSLEQQFEGNKKELNHSMPAVKNRFEAFVMTGDLILSLSKAQNYTAEEMDSQKLNYYDSLHQEAPKASVEASRLSSSSASSSSSSLASISAPQSTTTLSFSSRPLTPPLSATEKDINVPNSIRKNIVGLKHEKPTKKNINDEIELQNFKKNSLKNNLWLLDKAFESNKLESLSATITIKTNKDFDDNSANYLTNMKSDIVGTKKHAFTQYSSSADNRSNKEKDCVSNALNLSSDTPRYERLPSSLISAELESHELSLTEECKFSQSKASSGVCEENIVLCSESSMNAQGTIHRQCNRMLRKCDSSGFRTSKSQDHLQQIHNEGLATGIYSDIDEDFNSSLNTLFNTVSDTDKVQAFAHDRIVWTYNAPVVPHNLNLLQGTTSSYSQSSSLSISPPNTISPTSLTSISSSANSPHGSKDISNQMPASDMLYFSLNNGDQSVSEVISNISSPDYQDDNLLSSRDLIGVIASDPSDSDSTIITSEATFLNNTKEFPIQPKSEHKLIIKIAGLDANKTCSPMIDTKKDAAEEDCINMIFESKDCTDDSQIDVDSIHSNHYSPKAVDMPSVVRLAKRLFSLDGFKKSDVSRHLCKNNEFSKAVADEYLKYFNFSQKSLDESLREFLQQFALYGETQERERVLIHFSKRYLVCNPGSFKSQDAVHTLTCALMLLNADLHSRTIKRKMTCSEFIENLIDLNDGGNFPRDVLKNLYQAIKSQPIKWATDDDTHNLQNEQKNNDLDSTLEELDDDKVLEFKKGYMMRKCCFDTNNKKTPFGKRSWKMFFCTLRELVLYLHKDEHGFRKCQMSDNVHNAIRIHHALATEATDYSKKQHVFRLQTADRAEYLFQTSDSKELLSWIETINFICASFSAPSFEGGVGNQKRFQRPLLPSTCTKLTMKDQMRFYQREIHEMEESLEKHKKSSVPGKGLSLQNYKEKENYLAHELLRYKTYLSALSNKYL